MTIKFLRFVTILSLTALISFAFTKPDASKTRTTATAIKLDSVLRHVVLFKFTKTTTAKDLKAIEESFSGLPAKIKEIKDYEWGLNNSPEGLEKGFTHCFFVTFESEEGRATYLPHPDHKAFVALATPFIEDVLVVDYWSK
ncbi:Dabb family protein [uncultured Croceitalea sp.]|uniref:Dabb family protein n=1 Tax=uncultured Croceitalea sp. TaxID=1798908 RepID=UPI003305EC96